MMAWPTKMSESPAPGMNNIYSASPPPVGSRRADRAISMIESTSPSPVASISSDKENTATHTVNGDKARGRASMAPPKRPSSPSNKRKRGADRTISRERSQRRRTIEAEEEGEEEEDSDRDSVENYDPDQDIEERRKLRKGLRDLTKNLMDNRSEYMQPNSTGLIDTLKRANDLSSTVKQTADATIDSRLLVNAADLSYKKTLALTTGDTAQGVDVDEFVSKLITYMKRAPAEEGEGSNVRIGTQRRQRANVDNDSDGEGDEGDMLNWEYLGRYACIPNNSRPAVPGFLLGPLALEKRARKATVRKAALRPDRLEETRPEVLEASDISKSNDTNLTTLTMRILGNLKKAHKVATAACEAEQWDDMTEEEQVALLDRHSISVQGGISLFKFVINPHSFGQTIENMFYVSFLVRDGKVGIRTDDSGIPFLEVTRPRDGNEPTDEGAQKHQAVLALDMDAWEALIEVFNITEPMIPHREEAVQGTIGARGWYS